jgi:hypothetical protein
MLVPVLSVQMNDAAVAALGSALWFQQPLPALSPGLRHLAARGLQRRGDALTWVGSPFGFGTVPPASDLTGWECGESSFHLEDFVPVGVTTVDGVPHVSEQDQRRLLQQGVGLALALREQVYALEPSPPVRCIVSADETNGTFRFHQVRTGESWNDPDLDSYRLGKMVVVDIEPDRARG